MGSASMAMEHGPVPGMSFKLGMDIRHGGIALDIRTDGTYRLVYSYAGSGPGSDDLVGIGAFEGALNAEQIAQAKKVQQALCRQSPQRSPAPIGMPMQQFSVSCQGEHRQGSLYLYPRKVADLPISFAWMMTRAAFATGRRAVKLDVFVDDVEPQAHNFLVTVRFQNSGEHAIRFKSPEYWRGEELPESLGVGGANPERRYFGDGSGGGFGFELAGAKPLNAREYPDDVITVPAGESRSLRYLLPSDKKSKRGTYDFGALVEADIRVLDYAWPGAHVIFLTGDKQRKRITIDRDFPATPEEWDAYEAAHRAVSADRWLVPGQAANEDGYYRPILKSGSQRGRYVSLFHKGDSIPANARQLDENGTPFMPTAWVWEADVDKPIEVASKAICPRSGLWQATLPDDMPALARRQAEMHVVRVASGETMPEYGLTEASEARVRWVWLRP